MFDFRLIPLDRLYYSEIVPRSYKCGFFFFMCIFFNTIILANSIMMHQNQMIICTLSINVLNVFLDIKHFFSVYLTNITWMCHVNLSDRPLSVYFATLEWMLLSMGAVDYIYVSQKGCFKIKSTPTIDTYFGISPKI